MKILVFPKDDGNPYQDLLYTPLIAHGMIVEYLRSLTTHQIVNVFARIVQILLYRLRGYSVFHLHWIYPFAPSIKIKQVAVFNLLAYWYYIQVLFCVKILGYKLVWTVHNVLPHEPVFIGVREIAARQWLIKLADLVIVHSKSAIEEMSRLGLRPKRWTVIPHGSYVGVYPNVSTMGDARKKLGIPDEVFVYLFLGQIRDYKGVDSLFDAYTSVRNENTRLLIAGECRDSDLRMHLLLHKDKSVVWHDESVPDDELQYYFNAADVVVLPFKRVTTSGSTLLALSFGKPVIVPSIGDLANLPDTVAYKYALREGALKEKMIEAKADLSLLRQKSLDAKVYAESLSWEKIASQTYEEMSSLFTK